jgi:hypothetical protein
VPHFQRAGWPVRRVLTDGGPEFKGALMSPVARSASGTPAPNPAMPGPTASSNGCRGHDPSGALARGVPATLLHEPRGPAAALSTASCTTTTPSGRTKTTPSAVAPRPRSSGRGGGPVISFTTLERRKCQHRFESGQPSRPGRWRTNAR